MGTRRETDEEPEEAAMPKLFIATVLLVLTAVAVREIPAARRFIKMERM